ncbi:hypothetical protein KY309_00335 [Candidatus Woesearchaeota archaeon]|nr:hypothetical protein [Candidatus Woesearchaeota archaeon]MBW3016040.1 hypothetical protein [Candidatus Woesearchaeota archaeon]
MKTPHTKDYFEGILQIRNGTKELIDWVLKKIRTEGKAGIAKTKKAKNGIDLYITDQHYLQNLGQKLKQRQPGVLKISKRLHTTDKMTSKHLYRVTVLYKPFPFKKGDIITLQGEEVEIVHLDRTVQVKNTKSGAKKQVDMELLMRC